MGKIKITSYNLTCFDDYYYFRIVYPPHKVVLDNIYLFIHFLGREEEAYIFGNNMLKHISIYYYNEKI